MTNEKSETKNWPHNSLYLPFTNDNCSMNEGVSPWVLLMVMCRVELLFGPARVDAATGTFAPVKAVIGGPRASREKIAGVLPIPLGTCGPLTLV